MLGDGPGYRLAVLFIVAQIWLLSLHRDESKDFDPPKGSAFSPAIRDVLVADEVT